MEKRIRYSDFVLQPMRNHRFKVLKEIKYKDIVVPVGYKTNGGNVPRIFWSFLPPNETTFLPLYCVHDYLCDLQEYKKADDYLLALGKELYTPRFKLYIIYFSVRIYHILRYSLPKHIINFIKKFKRG